MKIERSLTRLRAERERAEPQMFAYDPDHSDPPSGVRYLTLAEAKALDCNMCGQCCGSLEADIPGDVLRLYTFGAIRPGQWATMNRGRPLIVPLTLAGRPRRHRSSDAKPATAPPFRCEALEHAPDGTTRCRLWQSRRPAVCDEFPVNARHYPSDLDAGRYVLLNTKFQRLCSWVDILLCPDDSVLLDWRKSDGTLPGRLRADRRQYASRVFREAYREAYRIGRALPIRGWRALRLEERRWRPQPL